MPPTPDRKHSPQHSPQQRPQRHGYVTRRPDDARAKCGGPSLCADCRRELAEQIGPERASWYEEALQWLAAKESTEDVYWAEMVGPQVLTWAERICALAVELARVTGALCDLRAALRYQERPDDGVLVALEVARQTLALELEET